MNETEKEQALLSYYSMLDLDACLPFARPLPSPKKVTKESAAPSSSAEEPDPAPPDKRNSRHNHSHKQ